MSDTEFWAVPCRPNLPLRDGHVHGSDHLLNDLLEPEHIRLKPLLDAHLPPGRFIPKRAHHGLEPSPIEPVRPIMHLHLPFHQSYPLLYLRQPLFTTRRRPVECLPATRKLALYELVVFGDPLFNLADPSSDRSNHGLHSLVRFLESAFLPHGLLEVSDPRAQTENIVPVWQPVHHSPQFGELFLNLRDLDPLLG